MPKSRSFPSASAVLPLCLCLLACVLPQAVQAAPAGTVTQLAGVLTAQKVSGGAKILGLMSGVDSGDLLSTSNNTYARIKFSDGGELTLRPNTQLRVDDYRFDQAKPQEDNAFFRLIKGGLRAVTGLVGKRNGLDAYRMATPTATIGIRGTDWGALYCEDDCSGYRDSSGQTPSPGLYVDVSSGQIIVTNPQGSQQFSPGQFGYIGNNRPPIVVPPNAGVPISTDTGLNKPPEAVLGNQNNPKDFQCTVDG